MKKVLDLFNRKFPILIGFYFLFTKQDISLGWYIISVIMNLFLKQCVFKPMMGDKTYPIIGSGTRPNSNLKTFGMPSGHAQAVAFLVTDQYMKGNKYWPIAFLLSLEVCYSRILGGHHTIQQIIIGYLIGIMLYLFIHKNIMKIR